MFVMTLGCIYIYVCMYVCDFHLDRNCMCVCVYGEKQKRWRFPLGSRGQITEGHFLV